MKYISAFIVAAVSFSIACSRPEYIPRNLDRTYETLYSNVSILGREENHRIYLKSVDLINITASATPGVHILKLEQPETGFHCRVEEHGTWHGESEWTLQDSNDTLFGAVRCLELARYCNEHIEPESH